uniref:Uncharacterized protein n=1 Tax=Anguilla anguilla TaxID=7936 RepID=A0A0E9QXC8_ANGAN
MSTFKQKGRLNRQQLQKPMTQPSKIVG